MLSRRHFLKLAGLGAAGLGLGLKPAALPLRLVATGRSVSPALLAAFTDSTGSLVHLDFLEDRGSIARHDLAVVPSHQLTGFIRESRVRPLGRLALPFAFEQRAYDPLNAFSLPAARGAIGINVRRTAPPASWAEFFD